jgi:hypothetical protein
MVTCYGSEGKHMPIPKYKEQSGIGVRTLDCSKILEGIRKYYSS